MRRRLTLCNSSRRSHTTILIRSEKVGGDDRLFLPQGQKAGGPVRVSSDVEEDDCSGGEVETRGLGLDPPRSSGAQETS